MIFDSGDYRERMHKLLNIQEHYKRVSTGEIKILEKKVSDLLVLAKNNDWICEQEFKFLFPNSPIIPAIYGLPKIHKNETDPPMRPIVSSIGSLLEPLSKYIDCFIKPMVQQQTSYLKDTSHAISIFEGKRFNRVTQFLVTLDIEALYTNIPQDRTIEVVGSILENEDLHGGSMEFIMKCLELVLKSNIFLFEDEMFQQVKGTSMGATCAPSLACLYVGDFEARHIFNEVAPFFENVLEWRRFIDDIVFIWEGEQSDLDTFIEWLNLGDPNLRFTGQYSKDVINFLDISIKNVEGNLAVELFTKKTDKNTLLHYKSFHPQSQRDNIPFGQFLRLRRNCSSINDFNTHAEVLKEKLMNRGYPKKLIKQSFKRAKYYNREVLVCPEEGKAKEDLKRVVFVNQFSNISNQIKNIVNRNWKILNADQEVQLEKPLFAFRKNKNIRNSLVKTYRDIKTPLQTTLFGLKAVGNNKCGSCSICDACIITSEMVFNNITVKCNTLSNCRSKNLIYLLVCPCGLGYVGETGRELRVRLLEHRSAIRTNKVNAPLTDHFSRFNHKSDEFQWFILEKICGSRRGCDLEKKRKLREQWYICRLNTVNKGLNTKEDWMALVG